MSERIYDEETERELDTLYHYQGCPAHRGEECTCRPRREATVSEPKLDPCPFCGSASVDFDNDRVFCDDCKALGPLALNFSTPTIRDADVAKRWNRRTPMSAEHREALESAVEACKGWAGFLDERREPANANEFYRRCSTAAATLRAWLEEEGG